MRINVVCGILFLARKYADLNSIYFSEFCESGFVGWIPLAVGTSQEKMVEWHVLATLTIFLSRTARFLCLRSAACCAALEHWSSSTDFPLSTCLAITALAAASLCHWESACCFRSSVPWFQSVIPLVFHAPLHPLEGFPLQACLTKHTITRIFTSDPGIFLFPFFFCRKALPCRCSSFHME